MRKKIKFKLYRVHYKGHNYEILIPLVTDQLWITYYDNKHWGSMWDGNRKSLESVMYATVILGFNPTNKIIYFPIRKNEKPEGYKRRNRKLRGGYSIVDGYDMIFTTHQVPFQRSDWKEIKKTFRYLKEETYTLCYDRERTVDYFKRSKDRWEYSADSKKEYEIETVQDATVFYVFSRRIFQSMYLSFDEFLERDLETEFLENEFAPSEGIGTGYTNYFAYRERLQQTQYMDMGFMDIELDKKKEEQRKRKEEPWVDTWDSISERERQRMEENPHRVTASGKDEKGCLFEETVYKNRTDYKTGELRKYDEQGNLIFHKMTYQYRYDTEEQIENTVYRYNNGTPTEAKITKVHKNVREDFADREEEILSETQIFRQYFYNDKGELERTEDTIRTPDGDVKREYTVYERTKKSRGDRGGIPLTEKQSVIKTYRRAESPAGTDLLLYQRTDVDFCEYERVKKRVRTELYYHKGSTRRAHKKSTTFIYKEWGKERLAKEIREKDALLHEYRDIDKDHAICLSYRIVKGTE